MKGMLLDPQATLYAQPDQTSRTVAQLAEGQELEITGTLTQDGKTWAAAVLPDEQRGYVPGSTRIARFRSARLVDNTRVYDEPSLASPISKNFPSGTMILILGGVVGDEVRWIRIRDASGAEGFVLEATNLDEPGRVNAVTAAARKNMIVGGLWCGGGIVVTAVTYSAASGGGTYVVAWGAIIFGAIQFVKGLAQLQ